MADVESGIVEEAALKIEDVDMAGETDVKLTGLGSAIMTMVKAIIGGGLLGLPFAFQESGWVLGLLAFPIIALLTGYCMLLIIHVKVYCKFSRTTTPSDIAKAAYGNVGKRILDVVLVIDSLGCCLSYFMFITANMELITHVRQEIWAAVFFVILLLAAFIRPIKLISYAAYGANVCVAIGTILLMIAVFVACGEPVGKAKAFNWGEFPIFLGIVLFAFQAIELALPVHNSLKDNNKFPLVMVIVLAVVLVLYLIFGMSSYLYLRENENLSMITEAIDTEKYLGFQIAIAVLFIISLFVNILCWIFPVYEVADRVFCANKYRVVSKEEQERILRENENVSNADASTSSPLPNPSSPSIAQPLFSTSSPSAAEADSVDVIPPSDSSTQVEIIEPVDAAAEVSDSTQDAAPPAVVGTPVSATPAGVSTSGTAAATAPADATAIPPAAAPAAEEESFGQSIKKNIKFWVLTTLGRIVTLLIIVIPSVTPVRHYFSSFLGLVGCTTGIFMTFIFPPACRVKVEWKTLSCWNKILDLAICILSIPLMIYVTILTLIDLINSLKADAGL